MNIKEWINDPQTLIIDVRTRPEFSGGHVAESINIPLQELESQIDELMSKKQAIVFCCAAGGRSGMATQLLRDNGFSNAYNGGGWMEVNALKTTR